MTATSDPSVEPLRNHPAFFQFWYSRLTASLAFQMLSVAVAWQIYEISRDPLDLGLIGLVQFIPSLLLALPAGHFADRFERRRIALVCQCIEGVAVAVLAVGTLLGVLSEGLILGIIFVIGVAKAFEWPAMQSMVPALVPPAILPRAMAVNASAGQAATIVGPALGGLLYVAGPGVVHALAASLYLVAAVLMWRLRYERAPPRREPATLRSLFAGIGFIKGRPVVLGALSLDLFAVLFGGATALLPIFAKDILHTGPWGLGLLRAAPAVGALLMALWLARHTLHSRVGHIMFASVAGFGVATLVFAVSTSFTLSLVALFALGAFDMVSMVIREALVQLETPDAMRGRVSAVNSIFINTSNQLGDFESGLTAAWWGVVPSAIVGGIGTLVVTVLWMLWFPALRMRASLRSAAPP